MLFDVSMVLIIIIIVLDNDGSTIETSDSISFNVSTKSEKKHFSILMQYKEAGSNEKGIEKINSKDFF